MNFYYYWFYFVYNFYSFVDRGSGVAFISCLIFSFLISIFIWGVNILLATFFNVIDLFAYGYSIFCLLFVILTLLNMRILIYKREYIRLYGIYLENQKWYKDVLSLFLCLLCPFVLIYAMAIGRE